MLHSFIAPVSHCLWCLDIFPTAPLDLDHMFQKGVKFTFDQQTAGGQIQCVVYTQNVFLSALLSAAVSADEVLHC